MKRERLMVILVVMMATFCFFFRGEAIELIKDKPLKPSQPSIQPSPKPPQVILLPDLIVERVWLDSHNRIVFTLKNIGNGYIPDDVHGRGNVRVIYGNSQKDYAFRVIDPGKALIRPMGVVSFTSGIELRSSVRVMVEVDITRQISEAREDNNTFSVSLIPKIAISQEPKAIRPQVGIAQDKMKYDLRDKDTKTPIGELQLLPKIVVYNPRANDQIFPPCSWAVKWRSEGEMNNRVRIKLLRESGELVKTIPEVLVNNPGENSYTCQIWPGASKQDNKIKVRVETIDGAVWGESGIFQITPPEIVVISPKEGERYYQGGNIPIRWRTKGKISDDKVDIFLLKPDNSPEMKTYGVSSPSFCEASNFPNYYKLKLPENIKPGYYRISVSDILHQGKGKNSGLFQIVSGPVPNKPDFVWVEPDLADRIHSLGTDKLGFILKNIGGKFVGSVDVSIRAMGFPQIGITKTLNFTEQNPFDNNESQLILLGPFDWPERSCLLYFSCEVDPNQKISELNRNNNKLVVATYPYMSMPHFFILDNRISLTSGQSTWEFKDYIYHIRLDSTKGISLGLNSVSMDLDFYGVNCSSGEIYSHNPRIIYFGPNCQKKEEDLGPVQMTPGEVRPFRKTIKIGLCKDSFIEIKTMNVAYKVHLTFTDKFLSEASPHPMPFPDRIYKPDNVQLVFARGTKILNNGGTVTLQKGDWKDLYRDEFVMGFDVRCKLKARGAGYTRLIFKMLSFGIEYNKYIGFTFPPEQEITLTEPIRMSQSPREGVLKIIDEQSGKEIFEGSIYCSDSLLKETGWRPWLHISQEPNIYFDHQKKEITIKSYVSNSGGPAKNEKWWLNLEIKFHGQRMQSKTWEFNGARESEFIERVFKFKPIYEEPHIYKLSLRANNKNILTTEPGGLEKIGSFDVRW